MAESYDRLWQGGKKTKSTIRDEQVEVATNLGYLTGVIDLGTQRQKKFGSDEMEDVHQCKLEFQFPKIEREYGDGEIGNHIQSDKMKVSNFKSTSPDMSNAKMVNVMLALGSKSLPAERTDCISFLKDLINKPLLVSSVQNNGKNGNIYDKIVAYDVLDKKVVKDLEDFVPSFGNPYFDTQEWDEEEFAKLQGWHQDEIRRSPEYKSQQNKDASESGSNDIDEDLPF